MTQFIEVTTLEGLLNMINVDKIIRIEMQKTGSGSCIFVEKDQCIHVLESFNSLRERLSPIQKK